MSHLGGRERAPTGPLLGIAGGEGRGSGERRGWCQAVAGTGAGGGGAGRGSGRGRARWLGAGRSPAGARRAPGLRPGRGSCVPPCRDGAWGPRPARTVGCGRRDLEGEFRRGLCREHGAPSPAGAPSRFLCKQEASAFSRCPGPCGQAAGPPASHFLQVAVVVCPLRRGLGARACPARAALCSVAAHAALRGRLCRPPASPVCTPLSPQGVDQNAKPLIIGPEEDYDPGCLNSEVAVPALLFLALRWHQLLAARSSLAASGWGGVGRKPWPGRPGADSLRAAASVSLPE